MISKFISLLMLTTLINVYCLDLEESSLVENQFEEPQGPPNIPADNLEATKSTTETDSTTFPQNEDETNAKISELSENDLNQQDVEFDFDIEKELKENPHSDKSKEYILNEVRKMINPSQFTTSSDKISNDNIIKSPMQQIQSEISRLEKELDVRELTQKIRDLHSKGYNINLEGDEVPTEVDILYDKAMEILNKTRIDKSAGYALMLQAAQKGHPKALAEIAWAKLIGNPLKLDIDGAKQTFLSLIKLEGLPEAHMAVGFMYATGIGFNVSQPKALLHYTFAALGDNTWAQMALGYRYWSGITVPNDCEHALYLYRKVAAKVASQVTFSGGTAVHRVRLLDEIENSGLSSGILDNDLIEYYQLLADKGDVQAQVGLGQLHYQGGRGIPLDHQKALQYFTQAANAGNAVAMAFLGKIYLEGTENVKPDNDTAFKYFKKAADLNNPVGQSGLGIMYLQGKGVNKDTTKAFNYFTLAADQGWVDGQLQLGNMYFSGTGVKRDFKMAYKYFNLASQSGHVLAFYNLGQMHAFGLGIIRSCPTAVELFKNVAEREKRSEKLMLAHIDYKSYHYEESFLQYALMGELGYEVAQSNAAFILDREPLKIYLPYEISGELNLFKNRNEHLVRALQYWGRAAAQGYSSAQVKLGDYYYYGLGTQIDYEAAASHYRAASELQHNAQAMFNLGYMHEQGLGMEKDWHLAKRFYDLAAETSSDAKVPVALALLKLQLIHKFETMRQGPFKILLELNNNIASNWDLYLITTSTILLGVIIYLRRPVQDGNQPNDPNQPNDARRHEHQD